MSRNLGISLGAVLVAIFFIGGCGGWVYLGTNKHDVTLTVESKERIAEGNDGKYLVFAEDKVYEVTDNLWTGDFSSSDRYATFEEGVTYNCTAVGARVPFFSMYENLIECEEAD